MFLPKEVGRRIVFLLLFLSISVLVPLESQSTRGLYYEIIVISWALMTVLLLSEDRFQPSGPLPSALFNYYITGSGGGERFAVERQHKEFKHFWNCFRSFSPSHSSESYLNTCWRWILIRQWNQLNLMQHLLSPPSFRRLLVGCSCRAIKRNYFFNVCLAGNERRWGERVSYS